MVGNINPVKITNGNLFRKIVGFKCRGCSYAVMPGDKEKHSKETGHKVFEPIFLMQ